MSSGPALIAFRCDASLEIGSGHLMRCLTLANAFRQAGHTSLFLCRDQPGLPAEQIRAAGHQLHLLPALPPCSPHDDDPPHAAWLGGHWQSDAQQVQAILDMQRADWLVVDHYALDASWESALQPFCRHLLVIDDLADRPHACELLLDQTFGRDPADYRAWVTPGCELRCGARHALLRPEFQALRAESLARRQQPQLRELLITLGGMDAHNMSGRILDVLRTSPLPADCHITLVMGGQSPALAQVRAQLASLTQPGTLCVDTREMAALMARSDLCIGAAGATAWERCCLGLPSFMLVLADNQRYAAARLAQAGAVHLLAEGADLGEELPRFLAHVQRAPAYLADMSRHAAAITQGEGCTGLLTRMLACCKGGQND